MVVLPPEIDYSNGQQVTEQLLAAFGPGTRAVIIDMMAVTFCDSAGLAAVVRANRVASARDVALRVAVPPGIVAKTFEVTGLGSVVPLYPSVPAALASEEAP